MHLSLINALLFGASAASAFQDTSPFMFFSTSELLFTSPQITTSTFLTTTPTSSLKKCPSNIYILAHQPGVSSADFTTDGATPHLKSRMAGKDTAIRSSFAVSEVAGDVEVAPLEKMLEQECGAGTMHVDASTGLFEILDDAKPRVIRVEFPGLPEGGKRRTQLRENDLFLQNLLEMIPTSDYTVVYTTSPDEQGAVHAIEESTSYQMEHHMNPLVHMELKRDVGVHARAASDNITLPEGPLFERYQFLTPAIFMGGITMIFLLSIAFVAVRAIASLEVSYGAFEKDMSQQQQKKAQ